MSNNLWLLIILVVVIAWFLRQRGGSAVKCTQLSSQELQKMLSDKEKISIIDVRTPSEYSMGHIPGASLRPLSKLGEWSKELDVDKKFVLVCASGHRSTAAIRKLSKLGFKNLYNLAGGMGGWKSKVVK